MKHTPAITTIASREVYRNHWMLLREDEILRSNGERGVYGVVEKEDAAIILPIDRGRVWLVEQFRYTIGERALELPQGGWEMEVDDPEELAHQDLGQISGGERFAFFGQRAGDQKFLERSLLPRMVEPGTQRAKFLRSPGVVVTVEKQHCFLVRTPGLRNTAAQ